MLKCENLKKVYKEKVAVKELSFTVRENEVFALLGSNGAGKTTTIKMILSLVKMTQGQIKLKEGITIGYSPETPYFPPFLTGIESLFYYGSVQGIKKEVLDTETRIILH